jgi:hypothetical protein
LSVKKSITVWLNFSTSSFGTWWSEFSKAWNTLRQGSTKIARPVLPGGLLVEFPHRALALARPARQIRVSKDILDRLGFERAGA